MERAGALTERVVAIKRGGARSSQDAKVRRVVRHRADGAAGPLLGLLALASLGGESRKAGFDLRSADDFQHSTEFVVRFDHRSVRTDGGSLREKKLFQFQLMPARQLFLHYLDRLLFLAEHDVDESTPTLGGSGNNACRDQSYGKANLCSSPAGSRLGLTHMLP